MNSGDYISAGIAVIIGSTVIFALAVAALLIIYKRNSKNEKQNVTDNNSEEI